MTATDVEFFQRPEDVSSGYYAFGMAGPGSALYEFLCESTEVELLAEITDHVGYPLSGDEAGALLELRDAALAYAPWEDKLEELTEWGKTVAAAPSMRLLMDRQDEVNEFSALYLRFQDAVYEAKRLKMFTDGPAPLDFRQVLLSGEHRVATKNYSRLRARYG